MLFAFGAGGGRGGLPHFRIVHSNGDVTITGDHEGLQMLNYTRHLCQLSSEGSLICHVNFNTGHPF